MLSTDLMVFASLLITRALFIWKLGNSVISFLSGAINSTTPSDPPRRSIWGLLAWVVSPLIMITIILLVSIPLVQIIRMKWKLQRNSISSCPDKNEDGKELMVFDSRGLPSIIVQCNSLPKMENGDFWSQLSEGEFCSHQIVILLILPKFISRHLSTS